MKIISLDRQINKEELEWAYKTAFNKTQNTIDTWKKRSDVQRFMDIFLGDLAKNLVASELKLNPVIGSHLEEYDAIRTDDFKHPDKFDLRLKGQIIEVKSSAEKFSTNVEHVFNNRRMIVNKNNLHEKSSDILIQVFFVPSNTDFFKYISDGKHKNQNVHDFASQVFPEFIKETKILLAGYFLKEDIEKEKKLFAVQGSSDNSRQRDYLDLAVKNSRNMATLETHFLDVIVKSTKKNTNTVKP